MKLFSIMKHYVCLLVIFIFNCLPIKRNKIFFISYYGAQYGCNPKYITEYILSHYSNEKFDLVWAFNDVQSKGEIKGFRKVKTMSIRYFYELCTSKIIITNFRTTDLFVKRNNQYYIQTWHSSLRLKQIEKDAEASLPLDYVKMAKKDSSKCNLLLSGCNYSTQIFKRTFWFGGEIFPYGTPRNDIFFKSDKQRKENIYQKLQLSSGTKVALYAPTFRKGNQLNNYYKDYNNLIKSLEKRFGGKWSVLVKMHPHLLSKSSQLILGEKVLDVTSYDDVQELLSIADILITDYSSLMFDYALTKQPCFLYVPDLEDYINNERQLYFDVNELPFITVMSDKELQEEIAEYDPNQYQVKLTQFLNQISSYERGNASEKLLKRIERICFEDERSEFDEAV
ncbi:CDP-glycerol glycerophosphotransferase family protein [Oceanobacillus halophilus]|uniref:Glycerophosphotransferase n=1 Tax=Oceanobacillus halophilus TaxID=930130 RepID=A0A495A1Z6_9BACI|nr:CDP-glycerol glycerophosphotransferase family protein [Oceanobacillus halophilus]RKQ33492.1 glycerophosphotransferase [Oceanobacillus halophilus]